MSSAIGTVSDLVKVIQAQLSGRTAAPAAAPGRTRRAKAPAPRRYAQEHLTGLIELRIAQIGRDDPQRGRKAFRVFLEAVLLSHFGEALVNDPRFFQMVDDVRDALEADSGCRQLIDSAIDQLLARRD